jgi:hypothetical protein
MPWRWRLCWCFLRDDDDDPLLFQGKTCRLPPIREESNRWWHSLSDQFPEVTTLGSNFKFPGRGQEMGKGGKR